MLRPSQPREKEDDMPKYLWKVRYSVDGLGGLMKEGGSARVAAATELVESVGGSVESFYFAFGAQDAFVIADMPSAVACAAGALTVGAAGGAALETVALLTPAEIDEATKASTTYRKPGA
jgi:uncharacterized protein with GYD domain